MRTEKLSERVARLIVADIFDRQAQPGDRLPPEHEMVEQLGVSRGSVREALRILEVHGLITVRAGPAGGPVVNRMSASNLAAIASLHFKAAGATVRDMWEARVAIEPMMARRAAEHCTEEMRQRLLDLLAEAEGSDKLGEAEYRRIAGGFHQEVARMTGNPVLDLFTRSLAEVTSSLVEGGIFDAGDRVNVNEQHRQVIVAIVRGDGDAAERLMEAHMRAMLDAYAKRYPGILEQSLPYTS